MTGVTETWAPTGWATRVLGIRNFPSQRSLRILTSSPPVACDLRTFTSAHRCALLAVPRCSQVASVSVQELFIISAQRAGVDFLSRRSRSRHTLRRAAVRLFCLHHSAAVFPLVPMHLVIKTTVRTRVNVSVYVCVCARARARVGCCRSYFDDREMA